MWKFASSLSSIFVVSLVLSTKFNCGTAAPPAPKKACIVKEINVQKNFNLAKFQGYWYDIARVELTRDAVVLSSGISKYTRRPNGQLHVVYGGEDNGRCIRPLEATGQQNGTNSAKLSVSFHDLPDGFLRGAFWVIEATNEHAIIYACNKLHDNGTCDSDEELAYIVGRNRTLQSRTMSRALFIVRQRLCIDTSRLRPTEHKFPCPPDPQYDLQQYLDRIITVTETSNTTEGDEDFPITHQQTPASGRTSTGSPVDTDGATEDESLPSSFAVGVPTTLFNSTTSIQGGNFSTASVAAGDDTPMPSSQVSQLEVVHSTMGATLEGGSGPTTKQSQLESWTDMSDSEVHHPSPTASEPLRRCYESEIPTQTDFEIDKFLGQWYLVATYSSVSFVVDSGTAVFSRLNDGIINSVFTGYSGNSCLPTFHGVLRETPEDPGTLEANYTTHLGLFKVVYVNRNYTYALLYQCNRSSIVDDLCQVVTIDVMSRTRHLTTHDTFMDDVMRHADDVCLDRSDFVPLKHEVDCPLEQAKAAKCRVDAIHVQQEIDWTEFSGRWFVVSRFKRRFGFESGTWDVSERVNGNVSASYVASRYGVCLEPVRSVWTTAIDKSGSLLVNYHGKTGIGKVVYTDYQSALYYECMVQDSDGSCRASEIRIEIWRRDNDAVENITLGFDQLIQNLCIGERQLEFVRHERTCDFLPVCRIPDVKVLRRTDLSKLLGKWKPQFLLVVPEKDSGMKRQLNELTFKEFSGTVVTCFTSTNSQSVCQATECATVASLFTNDHHRFSMDDDRNAHATKWRLVFSDDLYLVIYICHKVDGRGNDVTCSPSDGRLYVLSRVDGPKAGDDLAVELEPTLQTICLNWDDRINVTGKCPVEVPPYSKVIDTLPAFPSSVNTNQLMGIWYSMPVMGNQTISKVSKLRLSLDSKGKIDVVFANSVNGTCHPSQRLLATAVDDHSVNWLILMFDRQSGHVRILYLDLDIMIVYFCRRLKSEGICAPHEGRCLLLSRAPVLTDEKRAAIREKLRSYHYDSIDDVIRKAGFRSNIKWNVSFAGAAGCSVQTDENLCPIESLPVLKNLHFNKFLGNWFVVSRLKNSPSFDSAELRLTPGEETSLVYTGRKDGRCQRPLRGTMRRLADGMESQFEVDYGNGHFGRFQVIFTDYRSALVYQCLQWLSDGACLPGQVVVELLSRTNAMSQKMKVPLIRRTKDLCVNSSDMEDTTVSVDCGEESVTQCYIDDFPKDSIFTKSDLVGSWYVQYVARPLQGLIDVPSGIKILAKDNDETRFHYVSQFTKAGNCYSIESELIAPSTDKTYQMTFDFKGNNVLLRVIEARYGMMLVYVCKYVESDGRCRPDHGGGLVLSRNQSAVSEELLAHYSDLLLELCLGSSEELVKVFPSDCKPLSDFISKPDCDVSSTEIQPHYAFHMLDSSWYLAGRLRGGTPPAGLRYYFSRHTIPGQFYVHFTNVRDGRCLPTTKIVARQTLQGTYDIVVNNEHVEYIVLYSDDDVGVVYHCQSYDSGGRCDPVKTVVEVFTRNQSQPQLVRSKLDNIDLAWCSAPQDFVAAETGGADCPLVIEPECTISVPPMQTTLDLDQLEGYWFALLTWSGRGRNLPRISAIEIELSEDRKTMTTYLATSQNGLCLPTTKTKAVNKSPNNFLWRFQSIGRTGYFLLVHVDDDHLVLLECTSSEPCTPETASSVDVYGRAKAYLDEADKKKLTKILRRICHEIDNFTLLINEIECVVELRPSMSQCDINTKIVRSDFKMPQLTGSWYAAAKLKCSEVAESEMIRITGHDLMMSTASYTLTYTGSWRGRCLSSTKGQLSMENVKDRRGQVKISFAESSTECIILFTDYRYLVTLECRGLGVNDSCDPQNGIIAMYTREAVDITSIIPELIRVVGLETCFVADDFVSISHEVPCNVVSPSCRPLQKIPVHDNFTMDALLGVWFSLHHLRSLSALDSYTIRFHRDADTGNVVAFYTGSRSRICQPAVNFTISDDSREWDVVIGDKHVHMKALAIDESHVILYQCLDYNASQGDCHRDATRVNVLSRNTVEELSPAALLNAANSVHEACIEFGDLDMTHHSVSCRLPIIKKTGCKFDLMPVAQRIDYNKLGGVWNSYYILNGHLPVDYSAVILQPSRSSTLSGIFRSSRKDECLSVQTATIVPRGDNALVADLDAKFKSYTARFRVLYTDYNYALFYMCTEEQLTNGQCPAVHRQVAIYGRLKTGQLPADVGEKIFATANEACLYEEDFITATHTAECDLPYSGRQSCRLDHVIVHEEFELREIFGNWQLLARTTNRNSSLVAESIRFSPGAGGVIKYMISGEDSFGLCQRKDGTIEPAADQNSTFKFTENEGPTHLMKILFMNSQYLIFYICRGPLPADLEVCDESQEEVKIYGRMSVMSVTVRKMLTDIIWSRICLSLSFLMDVRYNTKCDLPSGCDIEDFILQENFDPDMVTGTWQVLIRSSFRQSSTLPGTAKFFKTTTDALNMVRVISQSNGSCHSENLLLLPTDGVAGSFQMQYGGVESSSRTLFLYVTDRYTVTLDCIGALSSEGECTADKVELTVWGRTWDLSFDVRRTLLQEIRDRTLTCYAIHAMMDIQQNDACELPPDACDVSQFLLEKDFDGRLMLGQWHLLSRSPNYKNLIRIGDKRISLSGQTYHIAYAGKHEGECFEMSGTMRSIPEMNSTFLLTSDNIQTVTRIVYWSEEYLLWLDCIGVSSAVSVCHPERTGIQLLSRTGYMDEDTMNHLIRVIRERTQSCVATRDLEPVPFSENICPSSTPVEGSEACGFDEIQLGHSINLQQLNGIWYLVARTNRVPEYYWDGGALHIEVKTETVSLVYAGYESFKENSSCFVEDLEADISPTDSVEWTSVVFGHNDTLKVVYFSGDHLMIHDCYKNRFDSHRYCHPDTETLEIFHRQRQVNSIELQQLLDYVSQRTCFSRSEILMANHTRKCEIPGILDFDHLKGRSCDVEGYPAVADFEAQKFAGIWYEMERTRYSSGRLWESGVFNFSLDSDGVLHFLYSGSRKGQCVGPVEGHARPVKHNLTSGDMIVWIGPKDHSDHPWTVQYRFKIVDTDYNHSAVVYSCHSTRDDGKCHVTSEQVFILGRRLDLDAVSRDRVYDVIKESLCIDIYDFVRPAREADCRDFVNGAHADVKPVVQNCDDLPLLSPTHSTEQPTPLHTTPLNASTFPPLNMEIDNVHENVSEEVCAIPMCLNFCKHGYALDDAGCETCNCRDTPQEQKKDRDFDPRIDCAIPMCANYCPNGYALDEDGCETCNCQHSTESSKTESIVCAIPMCANYCPNGYALDEDGCETCNCQHSTESSKTESTVFGETATATQEKGWTSPTGVLVPDTPDPGSELEVMVDEIVIPDVGSVVLEPRKTRTAESREPESQHLLPPGGGSPQVEPISWEDINPKLETNSDRNSEPSTREPEHNGNLESVEPERSETKTVDDQDKLPVKTSNENKTETREPDSDEFDNVHPENKEQIMDIDDNNPYATESTENTESQWTEKLKEYLDSFI